MNQRTLRIRIAIEPEALQQEAAEGDEHDGETLNFASPAVFFRLFTSDSRAILDALSGGAQVSLPELARIVRQPPDAVQAGVTVLVRLGVLAQTKSGEVRCPYDRIEWPATA